MSDRPSEYLSTQFLLSAWSLLSPSVLSLSLNPGATDKPRNAQEKSKLHSEWAQPVTPKTRDVENQGDQMGSKNGKRNVTITSTALTDLHLTFGAKAVLEPQALLGDISKGLLLRWTLTELGLGSAEAACTEKPRRFKKHKEEQCGWRTVWEVQWLQVRWAEAKSNKTSGWCWVPLTGHAQRFECKCLFIWRKHRKGARKWDRKGRKAVQGQSKQFTTVGNKPPPCETPGRLHTAHRVLPPEGKESWNIYPPILVHHWFTPAPGTLIPKGFLIQLAAQNPQTESCRCLQ